MGIGAPTSRAHRVGYDECAFPGSLFPTTHAPSYEAGPGLRIYDLSDPVTPAFVGVWAPSEDHPGSGTVHDAEIVMFKTADALHRFKTGDFGLTADVRVVAITAGAATTIKFRNGVAVVTRVHGGAMVDVSVAGQRFSYVTEREVR